MKSTKTSKKPVTAAENAAAPAVETVKVETVKKDTKPAKRTSAPAPSTTSHRHSKISVPTSPVTEQVVSGRPAALKGSVSREDIARLAYSYWEGRSFSHGSSEEDWHRAEKALSAAV